MAVPRLSSAVPLVAAGLLAGLALASAQTAQLDVIYVPTPTETVDRMLDVAKVGPGDFVIDLGCGDGRIAIAAVVRGARALGVDLDPRRIRDAKANAAAAGVSGRVTFREENLFNTDLSQATVLTLYLLPDLNLKLRPHILALKPGTRVVSHSFDMEDWKPDHSEEIARQIHFWIVPAQVEGRWLVRQGEHRFTLTLEQHFQQISGSMTAGGKTTRITDARLRGADIEFTAEIAGKPAAFRGKVQGKTMTGESDGAAWQASRS
jgi:SAM-dependent methyltransferase